MIGQALDFATRAHAGQTRKNRTSITPSRSRRFSPRAIAAAYLHDVVEDCGVTYARLDAEFGEVVTELVFWLTDASKPVDGNRALRKKIDRWHIAAAPFWAQTIKLADIIDNVKTIRVLAPDFARIYIPEKLAVVRAMTNCSPILHAEAMRVLT